MLRTLILCCFCCLVLLACADGDGGNETFIKEYGKDTTWRPEDLTSMEWETSFKDLGVKKRGPVMDIEFPFKNTGDKPLVIDSVIVTCGCTLFNIPKKPIAPGKKGKVTVRFLSNEQPLAIITRHVYVKANTKNSPYYTLAFKVILE